MPDDRIVDQRCAAAERQRRRRRRARLGLQPIMVEIDERLVADALIEVGRVSEDQSADSAAVAKALQAIIEEWAKNVTA